VWQIVRRLWTFLSEQLDASPAAGVPEPAAGDRQLILGVLKAGLEKPGLKTKKNSPVGFLGFFKNIFSQKKEFLGFFSFKIRILLGVSRL
jgi:hypothetical protein